MLSIYVKCKNPPSRRLAIAHSFRLGGTFPSGTVKSSRLVFREPKSTVRMVAAPLVAKNVGGFWFPTMLLLSAKDMLGGVGVL